MKAADVMTIARSFIGTKESPSGSNNVVFNTDYYGHPVRDGVPSGAKYPWCCVYVWDVFRIAGASDLFYNGKKTNYCPTVYDWAKKNGLIVDKTKGQYGDLILFDWNANGLADHIGFVLDNKGNGNYTTIEGNTSLTSNDNGGKVMERNRKSKEVLAIVRPRYSTVTAPKPETPTSTPKPIEGEYNMKDFKNTSGKNLTVYADTKKNMKVGEIYAGSSCKALDQQGNMVCVRYKVNTTGAYKVGWVDYPKGVQ